MRVREITAKSILSTSRILDYAFNPYVGCAHACVYCYAKFMKRFAGHAEQWGEFVDATIKAPILPGAAGLVHALKGSVDSVILDR